MKGLFSTILVACCSCFLLLSKQGDQAAAPVPEILPSLALSALETGGDAQQIKPALDAASDAILVYRVAVNNDGRILRSEKISGDSKLQTVADRFVSAWNFKRVEIKGSPSSWQSFLDVCFFRDGGYLLPCYLSQGQSKADESGGAARLQLLGNVKGRLEHFPPLRKRKGARLERPQIVRQIGGTGDVVVDVAIAEDGHVSETTGIMGPVLLRGATVKTVRDWGFEPLTFLGKPVEVQLRLTVLYGPKD